MAIQRPKVSSIVASQLPEFIRDEYQTFIDFLKAYYEFLETTQKDPVTLRDIDTTLDSFIKYFKSELAQKIPYSTIDERFLITRIKDLYLAKGTEASFKLLFRILFNKDIGIQYPATQMLRASDGKWNQDVSVFINITVGDPQYITDKFVEVVTKTKIIKVNVVRVVRISDTIYECILDRRFFGTISVGDKLRYLDNNNLVFNSTILPTTTNLTILQAGTGFKVGDLYNITNSQGSGTIMKVSTVDTNGGIKLAQFIKFGVGYTTDFSTSIISKTGQDTTAAQNAVIISSIGSSLGISENVSGFAENGSINTADYNLEAYSTLTGTLTATNSSATVTGSGTLFTTQLEVGDYLTLSGVKYKVQTITTDTSLTLSSNYTGTTSSSLTSVAVVKPPALDGTYAGLIIREFGVTSDNSSTITNTPAIIKVGIGSIARYPGYYVSNDGFLDDAMYIQDSKFYQAFSYVIKIDRSLETYKTIVKNLVHPSGMAVFGEYDLRNEFSISTAIESLIKILSITVSDSVVSGNNLEIKDISKIFNSLVYDHYLNDGTTLDNDTVGTNDFTGTLLNRLVPYFDIIKPLGSQLTYAGATENSTVSPTDSGGQILLNPYAETGFFLNDTGSYVGTPTTF